MSTDYHDHPCYNFDHLFDYSDHPLLPGDYPDHPDPSNYHPCHLGDYFDHPDDCPHHPGNLMLTTLTILVTLLTILMIILTINFNASKQSKIYMFHKCNLNVI